jgi:predicted dehydrogenase
MNAREAATAIAAAVKHEVVLLEAFMYRMHPQITELVRLLDAGTIGEVRMLEASFGGNMRGGYDNYRMQHEAGGGALLDLGCYGVSLARLVAGVQTGQPFAEPAAVLGAARLGTRSGVDEWSAAILDFGGPLIATVVCGNQVDIDSRARIWGSEGSIELTEPWEAGKRDRPGALVLHAPGAAAGETRVIDADRPLYALEADAFAEAVWHGRAPALAMTTDDSLGNMRVLDEWRRSVGLRFAQDSALRAHL